MENVIGDDEAVSYHRLRDGTANGDDSKLNQLGYKQELHRGLSLLANFSVTFSIISVITGITTLFSTGLTFGGPISMVYGWPIAGLFSLLVGLSMSEICSAYPTAAGLYFWSARLCGNDWGPFASWLTGWYVVLSTLYYCLPLPFRLLLFQLHSLSVYGETPKKYPLYAYEKQIISLGEGEDE